MRNDACMRTARTANRSCMVDDAVITHGIAIHAAIVIHHSASHVRAAERTIPMTPGKRIVIIDADDTIIDIIPATDYDLDSIHDAIALVEEIKRAFETGAKKERLRHVK